VTKAFEPLGGLTELYNKRTDLLASKVIARKNREESKNERKRLVDQKKNDPNSEAAKARFVTDLMQIKLDNVTVNYMPEDSTSQPVLENVSVTVNQGQLVAVTGPHGSGRATLLKIFGKVLFPSDGNIIVPTHLRSIHVSKEPILMRMSLWENLAFGLPKGKGVDNSAEEVRALAILKAFKSKMLLGMLEGEFKAKADEKAKLEQGGGDEEEEEKPEDAWQRRLTSLDQAIVHLVRGFLMNPEILVLQRPLSNFSAERGLNVLKDCFVPFVRKKGLCLPEAGEADRRPRTMFFVPESTDQAKEADVVWALEEKDPKVSSQTMTVKVLEDHSQMQFH